MPNRFGEMLGSGQFGEVFRGVWKREDGDIEIAVKTLKKETGEAEKIKFLQEAAIMGQFKHPSVVTMYGVVTKDEPVSIVEEYSCTMSFLCTFYIMCCLKYLVEQNKACNNDCISLLDNNNCSDVAGAGTFGSR